MQGTLNLNTDGASAVNTLQHRFVTESVLGTVRIAVCRLITEIGHNMIIRNKKRFRLIFKKKTTHSVINFSSQL